MYACGQDDDRSQGGDPPDNAVAVTMSLHLLCPLAMYMDQ